MMQFETKEQLFKHLKDNKNILIAEKKSAMKQADCISFCSVDCINHEYAVKSEIVAKELGENTIHVKVAINSTNFLDSHGDVHIPKLWNKSIKDNNVRPLIQEHVLKFDNIISENAIASVKKMQFKQLGVDLEGYSEVLIFESDINKEDNERMFDRYKKGKVKQHSVGMQYVTLHLCINSDDKYYFEEKENWNKYIDSVANKDLAIEKGYFWAVTEAKIIEGSAVVLGSNSATPTLEVKTHEPSNDTQKTIEDNSRENTINHDELRKFIKQCINN